MIGKRGAPAGATALSVVGCDSGDPSEEVEADVELDFSTDADVLNYAYALEQLEAGFYAQVAAAIESGDLTFENNNESTAQYFRDLAAHEDNHRLLLQAALGENAIEDLTTDFSGFDFGNPNQVLGTSQALEDTGVSAFNGAGIYLSNPDYLTLTGKIASVEARHAAAIRSLISPGTSSFADLSDLASFGANVDFALDAALTPSAVLAEVAETGFVVTTIAVVNT